MGLSFISAVYNEENEIEDLLDHVCNYVNSIHIMDDCSTDSTTNLLQTTWYEWADDVGRDFTWHQMEEHTGLPETVKNAALQVVEDDEWVLMLDADERFAPGVLGAIKTWLTTIDSLNTSHVYFRQIEIIDGVAVREFQKSKLFKKEAITFSTGIHEDDQFTGNGIYKPEWVVFHRKTSEKQKQREKEYLETYQKMLHQGTIDEGRYHWLRNLHHYYKGNPNEDSS